MGGAHVVCAMGESNRVLKVYLYVSRCLRFISKKKPRASPHYGRR